MPKPYVDAAKVSQFSIMAKIKIWPHEEICPNGADIESLPDETICEAALRNNIKIEHCLLYTSPSPRDLYRSRMPSSA